MRQDRVAALGGIELVILILLKVSEPSSRAHSSATHIQVRVSAQYSIAGHNQLLAGPNHLSPDPTGIALTLAPPTIDHRRDRPPSISAAQIDRILASYHSPAAGTGTIFFAMGGKYGIHPAYAVAFYIVESQAGTEGIARFTHGIGNIRATPGYPDYAGYRTYGSYPAGIEDWFKLIKGLYIEQWGLRTPDTILPRYAPWADHNNPASYAATVEELADSWQKSQAEKLLFLHPFQQSIPQFAYWRIA